MSVVQLIPSIVDRELTTGPGNWTGDFNWDPGPFFGQSGYLQKLLPPPNQYFSHQLQYPAVSAVKDYILTLTFKMRPSFHQNNIISRDVKLLDGVRTLSPASWRVNTAPLWHIHTLRYPAQTEWIKAATILRIEFLNGPWATTTLRWDDFSFTYERLTRLDHLPLMGVH